MVVRSVDHVALMALMAQVDALMSGAGHLLAKAVGVRKSLSRIASDSEIAGAAKTILSGRCLLYYSRARWSSCGAPWIRSREG
jgi:hypothetical protein